MNDWKKYAEIGPVQPLPDADCEWWAVYEDSDNEPILVLRSDQHEGRAGLGAIH